MLENKSISRPSIKSFQENLIQRLGPDEGRALDVLGADFFYLVDELSINLHEKHPQDAPLLDLSDAEFPWELQVFTNQFLRECAQTSRQRLLKGVRLQVGRRHRPLRPQSLRRPWPVHLGCTPTAWGSSRPRPRPPQLSVE